MTALAKPTAQEAEWMRTMLDALNKRIADDEILCDRLRHEVEMQRDGIDKLHKIIHDLQQQIRQAEVDKASLAAEQARTDFAFRAASICIAHLEQQLGKTPDDDRVDSEEIESLGIAVIQ